MLYLVVDDSRPTRNLIKNYISGMHTGSPSRFEEAENGETALDIIQKHPVDFIFLDVYLSTNITGLDVLKQIRSRDAYKHIPVIMISGESDKANVIESLKNGAQDFIVKPIDEKSFADKVLKVIKNMKNDR
jgi:two-component system chemotaxis response regulator CheY